MCFVNDVARIPLIFLGGTRSDSGKPAFRVKGDLTRNDGAGDDVPATGTAPGAAANRWRIVIGLVLCGLSFGFVEAAVVVYLRGYYEPLHQRLYPDREAGDLLPMIPLHDSLGEDRTMTELGRELATLVLLAGLALISARNYRQGLAAFVFVFGLWDLGYYLFLKVLIDWPASLLTWDILFLVPVPWVAPVLAPLLVAAVMVICGLGVFWREEKGQRCIPAQEDWLLMSAGAVIIWGSFCWDYRNVAAGQPAGPYPWWLLASGLAVAAVGFVRAWIRKPGFAGCRSLVLAAPGSPSADAKNHGDGALAQNFADGK